MSERWRLPTRYELNVMYNKLSLKGVGDFTSGNYWSSTEIDSFSAWYQDFGFGYQHRGFRDVRKRVRLIRALQKPVSNYNLVFMYGDKLLEVAEKDEPEMMTWNELMEPI